MKKVYLLGFSFLLLSGFCHFVCGDEPDFGFPFEPAKSGCEIIWTEKVQKLPEKVFYYSAGDHQSPEKIVQYFKRLGAFTAEHRVPPPESLPSREDSEVYKNKLRFLNISPMTGSMIYRYQPETVNFDIAEAPTAEASKNMAKKLLTELGFDLSLFSFERVRYTSGTHTRFDRSLGKAVTKRDHAGIFIPRLYDGVPSSRSGIQVNYGWADELLEFSMCWRDVKIIGQRKIPSREEIAQLIREGRSTILVDRAQNASRLTIDRAIIQYEEAERFRIASKVEPILFLSGKAEVSGVLEDFSMYLKLPN